MQYQNILTVEKTHDQKHESNYHIVFDHLTVLICGLESLSGMNLRQKFVQTNGPLSKESALTGSEKF